MTECTFFEEEPPLDDLLPHWATITQVSDVLEVPRNAIRSAVRKAVENKEDWVKKEVSERGRAHYLIDTTHEMYLSHEQRWKQNRRTRKEEFLVSSDAWDTTTDAFLSSMQPKAASSYGTLSHFSQFSWDKQSHLDAVLHRWTKFRQRLSSWGIQVFQNVLAGEEQGGLWQWRWGSLHGEGYPNEEEAIIAAIESRLLPDEGENEARTLDTASLFPQAGPAAHEKPQRFKFFRKRNDFPPF